jgi:hypothetical protein
MDETSARATAERILDEVAAPGTPLMIVDTGRREHRPWCHVFYWNSRRYVETGDPMSFVAGNGPIIVPNDGAPAFILPTYEDPNTLLDRYESDPRSVRIVRP